MRCRRQTQIQPPITAPPSAPLQILPPTISHDLRIVWEVKNRFRLFRREADFLKHVAAQSIKTRARRRAAAWRPRPTGAAGRAPCSAISASTRWARVMTTCERDGARENYLAPADHRVEMRLVGAAPQATCAWVFDEGEGPPRDYTGPCGEEVRIRLAYGKPTIVDGRRRGAGRRRRCAPPTEIVVRDLLIAGLGDSIAAGEGNPDRPVALSDEGFCFRRFGTGAASTTGRAARLSAATAPAKRGAARRSELAEWTRLGARWMSQACHRSLYGYQLRTALALAVENPHVAVTFLPLACTGATIENGVLGSQRARELNCTPDAALPEHGAGAGHAAAAIPRRPRGARGRTARSISCCSPSARTTSISPGSSPTCIIDATARARAVQAQRDLASVEDAESALDPQPAGEFRQVARGAEADGRRRSLARRVRLVRPSRRCAPTAAPARGGQTGFDVHPAFKLDGERHAPRRRVRRARASCRSSRRSRYARATNCAQSGRPHDVRRRASAGVRRARRVRALRAGPRIRSRLLPARRQDASHPARCRRATEPLTCGAASREFRAYAPRARWIRTANDSYFVAMTYPEGLPATLAADRHP